jgi:hypothetical protein
LRDAFSAVSTGFESGVHRQRAIESGQPRQPLEQLRQAVGVERPRRDGECMRLLDERGDDSRVRVAEADRRIRAHQVEIAFAIDILEPDALAAREHDRQRVVVARAVRALGAHRIGGRGRGGLDLRGRAARGLRLRHVTAPRGSEPAATTNVSGGRARPAVCAASACGRGAFRQGTGGCDFAKSCRKDTPQR